MEKLSGRTDKSNDMPPVLLVELIPADGPGPVVERNESDIDQPAVGHPTRTVATPVPGDQNKPCRRMMINAKNVTPSIKAAAMIMAV